MRETFDDNYEVRQRNKKKHRRSAHREEEYFDSGLPMELFKYVALAIFAIVSIICGHKYLEVSLAIVVIITLIIIAMGFLLKNAPIFVSVLIATLILAVGMLTKNTDIVLCGIGNFLGAVLVFRE